MHGAPKGACDGAAMSVSTPPRDRSQGDQRPPTLLSSIWRNLTDWLAPQPDPGNTPPEESPEPAEDATTRMDPVADLEATLALLGRARPGPLVTAVESLHAVFGQEASTSAHQLDQLDELEMLLSDLREMAPGPDEQAACQRALGIVGNLRLGVRRMRRQRTCTLLTANAHAAEELSRTVD